MPKAYPHKIKQLFEVLNCKQPLKMSIKFDSTEHVLSDLGEGFTTEYMDKHYVIHPTRLGERVQLQDVLPLAYTGNAAVFGEPETACKGFPFAIEDYFSSVLRTRVLMIKEGEEGPDSIIDDGWPEFMAWRDRPMELSFATKRPPVNFQVNLRSIKNQVMDGTWPAKRFGENQPKGQFCALLFPPDRMERDLWPVYSKARAALQAYSSETFREEDGCCWISWYRAGGEWCPPIEVAEGNFFFNKVKKELNKEKKAKKQPAKAKPEKAKPAKAANPLVMPEVSDDEFQDAEEGTQESQEGACANEPADAGEDEANIEPHPLMGPTGTRPKIPPVVKAVPAKVRNTQFTHGEDFTPGHDPINKRLQELGYQGAEKRNIYKMVRSGQIPLEVISPKPGKSTAKKDNLANQPQGDTGHPTRGASRESIRSRRSADVEEEYPTPRGDVVRFASFEGTKKLNALCQKGEFDRVETALKSPRPEWTELKTTITDKITTIKKFLKKYPEGDFQKVLNLMRTECTSEKSYIKVLGVLYGLMEIDIEDNKYTARTKKDPLESDDE
jgi:hypothetical protein